MCGSYCCNDPNQVTVVSASGEKQSAKAIRKMNNDNATTTTLLPVVVVFIYNQHKISTEMPCIIAIII
jgi:hypothetical protein